MVLQQHDLNRILEVAVTAARLAGRQMLMDINSSKVSIKNGNELVTQTDALCQKIIIEHITENFFGHGFLGEEGQGGKLFKQAPHGPDKFWWIIDPIDGTNNFVHRIPSFSVSIGVMHEGRPIVGVVFDPNTDSMFTAVAGGEACYNGTKMTVNDDPITEFASIAIDSNMQGNLHPAIAELMLMTRFRNMGSSALHLAYVAKGGLVGAVIVCPKLWDIAAGALLVERAGGIITDWNVKKIFPLDVEAYEGDKFRIIAANTTVHDEMVKMLY